MEYRKELCYNAIINLFSKTSKYTVGSILLKFSLRNKGTIFVMEVESGRTKEDCFICGIIRGLQSGSVLSCVWQMVGR